VSSYGGIYSAYGSPKALSRIIKCYPTTWQRRKTVRVHFGWLHRTMSAHLAAGHVDHGWRTAEPEEWGCGRPGVDYLGSLVPLQGHDNHLGPDNQIQRPGGGNNRALRAAPDPLHTHAPRLGYLKIQQDQPPVLREIGLADTQVFDRACRQKSVDDGRRRTDVAGLRLELNTSFGWVSHVVRHYSENLFPVSGRHR
jgi:hypothetical protein